MRIKERLYKLEKALKPDVENINYHVVFVGENSDGSIEETLGIIYYADGRQWFNPDIYPTDE